MLLTLSGAVANWLYLTHDCPIDLSGDEAQYWDWSRRLDISYYSKGPLVAYLIRASCAFLGETMPAVRLPAIVLGIGTSLFMYLLARRLFGSERVALGATALTALAPMFQAGSVLMTIDSPLMLCWAAATYFAARAIFDGRSWNWALVGVGIGVGFLAKYAAMLWFVGLLAFFLVDVQHRRWAGAVVALGIATLFSIPVIVWNAQHDWVSLRHVAHQTGVSAGSLLRGNTLEFIASQFGVLGPPLAVLMGGAVWWTLRAREGEAQFNQRRFLLAIGATFFLLTAITSVLAKVQVNWPAPAYFTLVILTSGFIAAAASTDSWRRWRVWVWATVALGVIAMPLIHEPAILFPVFQRMGINPSRIDFLAKARGWKRLGDHVSADLASLGPGAFVLCDDYMQTAESAFYTRGHPVTYCAGSYFTSDPKRFTQYDMWADRNLDGNPALLGRDAVYVGKGGKLPVEVAAAFASTGPLERLDIIVRGARIRTFWIWRCRGFLGMRRPEHGASY
ncbi:MAG: ArnT family glycosyltransferase [Tepidisphaeraceae bacterium]